MTEPRWYCLSREGMATLCTDKADAEMTAINADELYPRAGPHRAVQLVEAAPQPQQAAPVAVPAGMKLVPDWKGYALLGSGRYLLDNSSPPADPELGPELIITLASEKDREGREIGERRDSPARVIQPEEMVIRIGFLNERGLFALENQLRILREEHWPETVAASPQAAPAPPQGAPADLAESEIEYRLRIARLLAEMHGEELLSEQQCAKYAGVDLVSWRRLENCFSAGSGFIEGERGRMPAKDSRTVLLEALAATPPQQAPATQPVALTNADVVEAWRTTEAARSDYGWTSCEWFQAGVRFAQRFYGITQPSQQERT